MSIKIVLERRVDETQIALIKRVEILLNGACYFAVTCRHRPQLDTARAKSADSQCRQHPELAQKIQIVKTIPFFCNFACIIKSVDQMHGKRYRLVIGRDWQRVR